MWMAEPLPGSFRFPEMRANLNRFLTSAGAWLSRPWPVAAVAKAAFAHPAKFDA